MTETDLKMHHVRNKEEEEEKRKRNKKKLKKIKKKSYCAFLYSYYFTKIRLSIEAGKAVGLSDTPEFPAYDTSDLTDTFNSHWD